MAVKNFIASENTSQEIKSIVAGVEEVDNEAVLNMKSERMSGKLGSLNK